MSQRLPSIILEKAETFSAEFLRVSRLTHSQVKMNSQISAKLIWDNARAVSAAGLLYSETIGDAQKIAYGGLSCLVFAPVPVPIISSVGALVAFDGARNIYTRSKNRSRDDAVSNAAQEYAQLIQCLSKAPTDKHLILDAAPD